MKKIEICLQNIDDIILVNKYECISRIELNSAIEVGGLTPDINLLKNARKVSNKKIISMIRIRSGNFIYTDNEFEIMLESAKNIINYCDGLAFGALNEDLTIDVEKTKKIINLCRENNKEFVFHRAIDIVKDYKKSIELLDKLGVDRILTSGHEVDAVLGFENIKRLNTKCEILIGSGINIENINLFNGYNIHGTFSKRVDSKLFGYYLKVDEKILDKIDKMYSF
ncbi:copper homeostasis protein CutC [Caviibacter abscessus]|uniref:copper homeostasis protein CutC n=1 Tax=Caviibacter abscessus TaxID=1766719 RepID=UPI000836652A|nr:copper homeostasis protein CutC [Caviibacter abscessus]